MTKELRELLKPPLWTNPYGWQGYVRDADNMIVLEMSVCNPFLAKFKQNNKLTEEYLQFIAEAINEKIEREDEKNAGGG